MRWIKKYVAMLSICLLLMPSKPAKADFFGGDLVILSQILVQTIQQLASLRQIFSTGQDTLGLIRDLNNGIREAMAIVRTMNTTMQPGVLGQIQDVDQLFRAIQDIYGSIPKTPDSRVQQLNDQSVAEAMTLHNQAFQYAAQIDPEAERIKDYARLVSPNGAGKLTAQSLGVLIHVMNQVLRTNASMLKIMSQNLAMQNRKEKVSSHQFRMEYEGLSTAFGNASPMRRSARLNTGGEN